MFIIQLILLLVLCYLIIQGVSLACVAMTHNNKRKREDEAVFKSLVNTEYQAVEGRAYRNECR